MPPGMTTCLVASITRLPDSAASVPSAAMAAMVSPATAISQRATPCGVTTSPPRMIRSNITISAVDRKRLAQGLVHAVLVAVVQRNETAGLQAVGKPREALTRHFRGACPKFGVPVALEGVHQNVAGNIRVIGRNHLSQLRGAVLRNPAQR